MEEKDQTSLTINDILDQLVKPSIVKGLEKPVVQQTIPAQLLKPTETQLPNEVQPQKFQRPSPAPVASQAPLPSTPVPKSEIKLPQLGGKKEPDSLEKSESGPQNLKLSVRTMASDLEWLRQGKRPSTEEVQKVVGGEIEMIPPLPRPQASLFPRISTSVPRIFKEPKEEIRLPEPPVIQSKIPDIANKIPEIPKRAEGSIQKEEIISDANSLPAYPGAPIPRAQAPKLEEEKVRYGIIAKVIGSGMSTGIIGTIIVASLIYLGLYLFVFKDEELVLPTPLPTSTITATPAQIKELETIFSNLSLINFSIPEKKEDASTSFTSFINKERIAPKELKRLNFIGQTGKFLTFTEIFESLSISYPPELKNHIKDNHLAFLYGQEEMSQQNQSNGLSSNKVVFIVESGNSARLLEIMRNWEATMPADLKDVFKIDPFKQASEHFLDNEYRGVKIRYKNFPLPDKTIDYALITSLSGKRYLIISNSRASMYSPADKIQGIR